MTQRDYADPNRRWKDIDRQLDGLAEGKVVDGNPAVSRLIEVSVMGWPTLTTDELRTVDPLTVVF